ncbi:hypothetical protein VP1G_11275 [Cytospora mali]|uniref:Uncharacterized protein n=1 Tax=Cytospora mali TaxID=578113 RepID=A0A194VAN7_CYTMA|nr:hypothetical protein VP1G_11275 [Valsa mali var. pyri (nom. inval.)]
MDGLLGLSVHYNSGPASFPEPESAPGLKALCSFRVLYARAIYWFNRHEYQPRDNALSTRRLPTLVEEVIP